MSRIVNRARWTGYTCRPWMSRAFTPRKRTRNPNMWAVR
jgi:hypothetical protein